MPVYPHGAAWQICRASTPQPGHIGQHALLSVSHGQPHIHTTTTPDSRATSPDTRRALPPYAYSHTGTSLSRQGNTRTHRLIEGNVSPGDKPPLPLHPTT